MAMWRRQSRETQPLLARTWIADRGSWPPAVLFVGSLGLFSWPVLLVLWECTPEEPVEERVRVAFTSCLTLVAEVPRRKKRTRRVNGMGEGWRAWMVAVAAAVIIPGIVREPWV